MLRILADPADEEHRDTLEWVGPGFRPDAFDPGAVRFDSPRARWKLAIGNG